MKATKVLAAASVIGVIGASTVSATALAWHPKGVITKSVMNQTAGGQLSDANDAKTAVSAKTGDTLKYVIEVRNDGQAGDGNQMFFTKLTDTLPAGVELIANPATRELSEDLGTIKPGEKVTKEYLVKVTSTKDGDMLENKACFTGDSEVKDNPQKGCDVADVTVSVPKEETPTPTPTPQTPAPTTPAATQPAEDLPKTGASELLAPVAAFTSGAAAYVGRMLHIKRRQK